MFIDSRKKNFVPVLPDFIKGHQVEVFEEYKYLGTVFDDKLKFKVNTNKIRGKALQRMQFLRMNFHFELFIWMFLLRCFILVLLNFTFYIYSICCYGNLNVKNRGKLNSTVKMCSKIVGTKLRTVLNTNV